MSGGRTDVAEIAGRAAAGDPDCTLALEVFSTAVATTVAGYTAVLGGLDTLVFTGGIGEHSVEVRRAVLGHLGVLGLCEDPAANAEHGRGTGGRVSPEGPTVALVVPTDEELVIARDTARLTT
jgi:acetate kinase